MIQYQDFEIELLNLDILEFFAYKYGIPKCPELDNEVYYDAYYTDKRNIVVIGGRGSGKSADLGAKYIVVHLACLPFCRFIGIRQVASTIEGSMYQNIIDYIYDWKLEKYFHITKKPLFIKHKESGNFMRFLGMDKPDSIKSIADPTHVVYEEAYQIKDAIGVDKVEMSIRTPKLIHGSFKSIWILNPDNIDHWIYEHYYDDDEAKVRQYSKKRERTLLMKTTHWDNKFLPQVIRDTYENYKFENPERYKVDVLAEWGTLKLEGTFYDQFDYVKTVERGLKDRVYDRTLPLHIALDFNVKPYISLEINQMIIDEEKMEINLCAIDEICLTDNLRMGNIDETMKEFLKRYHKHLGDVLVYGDSSGHNKKTNAMSDFGSVFMSLKFTPKGAFIVTRHQGQEVKIDPYPEYKNLVCQFQVKDRTYKSNPLLAPRRILFRRIHQGKQNILPLSRGNGTINAAGQKRPLSMNYAGYKVVQKIDQDNCKKLVKDYQEVIQDPIKGGKLERPAELTHTSDAEDYFVTKVLDAEYQQIKRDMKL